jgi:hypothetical protein
MPLWALSGSKLNFTRQAAPAAAIPAPHSTPGPPVSTVNPSEIMSTGPTESDLAEGSVGLESAAVAKNTAARPPLDDRSALGTDPHHLPAVRDQMREIQQRLVAKGADAMLLELLDSNPASYRFWCQMPISTSSMYGRRFEAVAADPVSAMRQVDGQVDAWQACR